jgi:hypothetical protein
MIKARGDGRSSMPSCFGRGVRAQESVGLQPRDKLRTTMKREPCDSWKLVCSGGRSDYERGWRADISGREAAI